MPNGSWLVADMTTGEVIAAKAPHRRLLPASTLKTLTALTLIPRLHPDTAVTATGADANADGTRVGLLPGTAYRARNLFQGMLMASGNDAAYALARANGGLPRTVSQMNETARHLGALDTLAVDPSGLDGPGQSSSAYDLALIGRAAMQLPDFRAYVATKRTTFPGGRGPDGRWRKAFALQSHNRLLWNYDGTIGIKNGYTIAAKQTFIGAATRGGHTYIVTQMAGTNGSWRVTAKLLDWAFAYGGKVTPVGHLVEPGELERQARVAAAQQEQGRVPAGVLLAASPGAAALSAPPLRPWAGAVGLLGAVGLVAVLAARSIRRHRR
jgi:D-alanyl-D-alanine carboxypeptidase (penicillin-binding protein 5/6)